MAADLEIKRHAEHRLVLLQVRIGVLVRGATALGFDFGAREVPLQSKAEEVGVFTEGRTESAPIPEDRHEVVH